jgi:hypothetical protein
MDMSTLKAMFDACMTRKDINDFITADVTKGRTLVKLAWTFPNGKLAKDRGLQVIAATEIHAFLAAEFPAWNMELSTLKSELSHCNKIVNFCPTLEDALAWVGSPKQGGYGNPKAAAQAVQRAIDCDATHADVVDGDVDVTADAAPKAKKDVVDVVLGLIATMDAAQRARVLAGMATFAKAV